MLLVLARTWAALGGNIAVSSAPGAPFFGPSARTCVWLLPECLFPVALKPLEALSAGSSRRASRCTATEVSAPVATHCPSRCSLEHFFFVVSPSVVYSACRCSQTTFQFFRLFFENFVCRLFAYGGCQTPNSVEIPKSHFRNSGFRLLAFLALVASSTSCRSEVKRITSMAVAPTSWSSATPTSASTTSSSCSLTELPLSLLPGYTFLFVATLSCVVFVELGCCNLAAIAPAGGNVAGLSKPILFPSWLSHFLLGTCSRFASRPSVTPATAQAPSISRFVPPRFSLSKKALSPGRASLLFLCVSIMFFPQIPSWETRVRRRGEIDPHRRFKKNPTAV